MRALLVSIVLAIPCGFASADDAAPKQPAPPLEQPKPRQVVINDGLHHPSQPAERSCEPSATGQLECKASGGTADKELPGAPAKPAPIAIHDPMHDGAGTGRACEPGADGRLVCTQR